MDTRTGAPPEPWIGLSDAARLAGVSETAIRKARLSGRIRAKQVAGRTLYSRHSVEQYAARRGAKAAA